MYTLSLLLRLVGHRVSTHTVTPVADNEYGDIEIRDYVVSPRGEENRIPPHTLLMDVTMTHDHYGRTTHFLSDSRLFLILLSKIIIQYRFIINVHDLLGSVGKTYSNPSSGHTGGDRRPGQTRKKLKDLCACDREERGRGGWGLCLFIMNRMSIMNR